MGTKARQSGIELLRILTMFGVVFLHYNDGRGFAHVEDGSVNYYILFALESLCICAVDLFIIISGYFLCNSQRRSLGKIFSLILEYIIVKEGFYICTALISDDTAITVKGLVFNILPNNYFIILYAALYIISPYINIIFSRFSKREWNALMVTAILLFSVWPCLVDLLGEIRGEAFTGLSTISRTGSSGGFNIMNFILMYLVGSYLRKNELSEKLQKKTVLLPCIAGCAAVIFAWAMVTERLTLVGLRSSWVYHNPLVILLAVMLFLCFAKMKFSAGWVNELAKAAFTCFLVHNYLLDHVGIEDFVNGNTFIMLGHIIAVVVGMYLLSYVLFKLYDLASRPLISRLNKIEFPEVQIK